MARASSWMPLVDSDGADLARGAVLRLPAAHPYEAVVDFMVVECRESPSGFSLMVVTGYKAGLVLVHLPREARSGGLPHAAVSSTWLVENWTQWVYERGPDGVFFAEGYEVDSYPP